MASQKPTKAQVQAVSTRLQVIGLVLLLLALMSTSVVTVLMASGRIDVTSSDAIPVNSMTDAQYVCDRALLAEHGEQLQNFFVDDLSSRSDTSAGGYKLYYELRLYRDVNKKSGTNKFFVNCFVASNGTIRRMDLYEEKDFIPKPVRRTHGNAFGM